MPAPRKYIPENVGSRISQLSALGHGSRKIARAIAQEFGPEHSYSHQHIQNYLNATGSRSNVTLTGPTTNSYYEKQLARERSVGTWQVPDVYVTAPSYPTWPSTIILPYQHPQSPPSLGDSFEQVMLDLIREKGKAEIWRASQPPLMREPQERLQQTLKPLETPQHTLMLPEKPPGQSAFQPSSSQFMKNLEAIAKILELELEKRKEERAKRLAKVQDAIDELRKKMDEDFAKENSTALADKVNPVSNHEQDQTLGSISGKDFKKEQTGIEDSLQHPSNPAAKTEPSMPATSNPKTSSDPGVGKDGFSQEPGSTKPDVPFRMLEASQPTLTSNILGHAPLGPTEKNDQLRLKTVQAAQDAGLSEGSHSRDDGSSTNPLLPLVGVVVGVLGLVCGIDYLKAHANSKPSSEVNRHTQPFTPVAGYSRVNDPNGVAIF